MGYELQGAFRKRANRLNFKSKQGVLALLHVHRISELERLIQSVYENMVIGKIPEEVCVKLIEKYQAENKALQSELDRLTERLEVINQDERDGLISRIIVKKYDHFSRNMRQYLNITDEIDHYGVTVYSLSEPFNTETKEGRIMRNNLLNFAEFERETIAARVPDSTTQKAI